MTILGDGDFVGRVRVSAGEAMEKCYAFRARGVDLALIAKRISEVPGVKPDEVWAIKSDRLFTGTRLVLPGIYCGRI